MERNAEKNGTMQRYPLTPRTWGNRDHGERQGSSQMNRSPWAPIVRGEKTALTTGAAAS